MESILSAVEGLRMTTSGRPNTLLVVRKIYTLFRPRAVEVSNGQTQVAEAALGKTLGEITPWDCATH